MEKSEYSFIQFVIMISSDECFNKLLIYQTCLSFEQSIRGSYQALLSVIEVALFGLALSFEQYITNISFLILLGILLCFPFGIACEFRARNADVWQIKIIKLVKNTGIEKDFNDGKYRWIPYGNKGYWWDHLFGHWYERILISIALMIWIFIAFFYFPQLQLINLFSICAFLFWIIYVFQIINPTGEIMLNPK